MFVRTESIWVRKVGKAKSPQHKIDIDQNFEILIHSLNDWQYFLVLADLLVIESVWDEDSIAILS